MVVVCDKKVKRLKGKGPKGKMKKVKKGKKEKRQQDKKTKRQKKDTTKRQKKRQKRHAAWSFNAFRQHDFSVQV